jgi:hypothetical protein
LVSRGERAPDPTGPGTTLVLLVGGPIDPSGVRSLCERARALMDDVEAELIVCDLGQSGATAGTVDAIGRLKLLAANTGRRVRFVHASAEVGDLLDLIGLADVIPLENDLTVEPQG